MSAMTPEQRKARRQELAARKVAEALRAQAVERYRKELTALFEKETGYDATLWHGCPDTSDDGDGYNRDEFEYDNHAFVDWLILRYVAAAGPQILDPTVSECPASPIPVVRSPRGAGPKPKKPFNQRQLERLAAPGYWVEGVGAYVDVICISHNAVKYCRSMWKSRDWTTLLWSCAPTKRTCLKDGFQHYPTHAEMMAAHPEFADKIPYACHKAPNDFWPQELV